MSKDSFAPRNFAAHNFQCSTLRGSRGSGGSGSLKDGISRKARQDFRLPTLPQLPKQATHKRLGSLRVGAITLSAIVEFVPSPRVVETETPKPKKIPTKRRASPVKFPAHRPAPIVFTPKIAGLRVGAIKAKSEAIYIDAAAIKRDQELWLRVMMMTEMNQ